MKSRKTICLLLICVLALFGFGGCGKKDDSAEKETDKNANPIILLNGFEDAKDLNTLMMYEYLGKVEIETENKEYVKSGAASGKITVQKNIFGGSRPDVNPYLFQSTRNVARGLDENDFSYTTGVALDVYNPQAEAKQIGVRLVYKRNYNMVASLEKTEWHTLKPESWTTVHLNVVRGKIPMRTVTAASADILPVVIGIDMLFKTPSLDKSDDIFYVDDVRLYKTTEPYTVETVTSVKKHEICSFDHEWQVNNLAYSNHVSYLTSVSWSRAFTSDGGSSLQIETGGLTYVQIRKGAYFPDMELSDYKDEDRLCMEIYSPKENGYANSIGLYLFGTSTRYFYNETISLSPGTLCSVSIPVSELNSTGNASTGDTFEFLTYVQFSVRATNSPQLLYIDNIRMEVAK